jgi:hypothetical protein
MRGTIDLPSAMRGLLMVGWRGEGIELGRRVVQTFFAIPTSERVRITSPEYPFRPPKAFKQ